VRLLFEQPVQDKQRVAERAGNHNPMKARELVRSKIVICHTSARAKVFAVGTSIKRADRRYKA